MSILRVAERLKNADMDKLVYPYLETTISLRRIYLILMLFVAVFVVERFSHNPVILREARSVLPALFCTLVLAVCWAIVIRKTKLSASAYKNTIGTIFDFLGIFILMSLAWNLMLLLIPVLIFNVINTGTRYAQKYFYLAIFCSLMILFLGAPWGYWASRPLFVVLALFLMIGLPLSIQRLVTTLQIISEIAISASEAQARFMNTVSHELRTPLNSVITGSTLLYDAPFNDNQRTILKLIEDNGRYLLAQVNEILDHAAMHQPGGRVHLRMFRMSELLRETKAYAGVQALSKDIEIITINHLECDMVICDRTMVANVMNNLVGNAVKYSDPSSQIKITVSRLDEDTVKMCVLDNGVGIPDAQKESVFELFYRTGDRIADGFGFGLNLVKICSELLGARIRILDNTPKGTIFEWTVPMKGSISSDLDSPIKSLAKAIDEHKQFMPSINCLIVDDNISNCIVLSELLHKCGHTSVSLHEGHMVYNELTKDTYNLIILDINLGLMNGWDVLRNIHDMGLEPEPKVIISSAAVGHQNHALANSNGAQAYLSKPIDPFGLISLIEHLFLENSSIALDPDATGSPLKMMRDINDSDLLSMYLVHNLDDLLKCRTFFNNANRYELIEYASYLHFLKNVMNNLDLFKHAESCEKLYRQVKSGEIASDEENNDVIKRIDWAIKFVRKNSADELVVVKPGLD